MQVKLGKNIKRQVNATRVGTRVSSNTGPVQSYSLKCTQTFYQYFPSGELLIVLELDVFA